MAKRVFLDIDVGEPALHQAAQQRFERTGDFFDENKAQLGLAHTTIEDLDEEGRDLVAESLTSRLPDAVTERLILNRPLMQSMTLCPTGHIT